MEKEEIKFAKIILSEIEEEKFLLFILEDFPSIVLDLYDDSINLVLHKEEYLYKKADYDKKLKEYNSQFNYGLGSVDIEYILNDFEGDKKFVDFANDIKKSFEDLVGAFGSLSPKEKIDLCTSELGEGY